MSPEDFRSDFARGAIKSIDIYYFTSEQRPARILYDGADLGNAGNA